MELAGRKRISNCTSSLPVQGPTKRNKLPTLSECNRNDVIATSEDMKHFFDLLEDSTISRFLSQDTCFTMADKYLLAMVFVYFRRARLKKPNYTKTSFFAALFLAHDMEEDEEDFKLEIFPWILGKNWQSKYPKFLLLRDKLWASMNHRAVVSKRCCDEVFSITPNHPIWKRERYHHHSGCSRDRYYEAQYPRGPNRSPLMCEDCVVREMYSTPNFTDLSYLKIDTFDKENSPAFQKEQENEDRTPARFNINIVNHPLWSVED